LPWQCPINDPITNFRMITYSRSSTKNLQTWCVKVGEVDFETIGKAGSVLFISRPRSEGWPHHGRTFSIYPCLLSFWLTLPRRVLSTSWYCPSRPCVVFLACVHPTFFLASSLSPGNSLVSSWCEHSMLASLLSRCLTVPSLLQLCLEKTPTHLFSLLSIKPADRNRWKRRNRSRMRRPPWSLLRINQSISLFASKYTYLNIISVNGRSPEKHRVQLAGDL